METELNDPTDHLAGRPPLLPKTGLAVKWNVTNREPARFPMTAANTINIIRYDKSRTKLPICHTFTPKCAAL